MKKILFVAVLSAFCSLSFGQGFDADLILGVNFSQVDGDALAGYNKLGIHTGVAITRDYKEDWRIGFELLYSAKGARNIIDPDVGGVPIKIKWNYIEIPVLATYSYTDKLEFYGGPSIAVNILNERIENGVSKPVEDLRPLEVSLILGGTYNFSDNMGLFLRHGYSLSSVRNQNIISLGPTWFGRAGWYNRLFTVGLRYRLRS